LYIGNIRDAQREEVLISTKTFRNDTILNKHFSLLLLFYILVHEELFILD